MPDWTRRVSGRYLCADADIRGPLCRLWANKKPAEEKILAGHTCPRPFSYLFYVASKPADSHDHEIDVVKGLHRLPVKAPKRLPSCSYNCGPHPDEARSAVSKDRLRVAAHASRRALRALL